MNIEKVKNLKPLERLMYWITERHSIYLKRQAGEPPPWTDDEILQTYKFCNVIRAQDRVSDWLINNWYNPFKEHDNMLVACTLARQLNNTDSLSAVGFPEKWQPEKVEKILYERQKKGLKNYSSAYMITANYGQRGRAPETKQYQTVWRVCQPIYEGDVQLDTRSMRACWSSLKSFPGFSSFIAGQVVADLRWGLTGSWGDRMDWAPMGPGSNRGLNRLLGRPLVYNSTERELTEFIKEWLPKSPVPDMEAIDLQNCLCEFDKYERALHGEGRPKNKYLWRG